MHFIGRANLSKRSKRLETCHASFERQCQIFLEVAQNGIDKATSIKSSRETRYSSKRNHCCGECRNDLAMIEYAGLGVWVDNVDPELRDRADFIVSNNNHGVAEVVRRFILN
jgi:hydroxymethylpyrimidine pyrophosphatase-like HAD family hydrolase